MLKGILHNVGFALALLLVFGGVVGGVVTQAEGIEAATSANITISATPAYVAMNLTLTTWTVNGITGDGVMRTSQIYLANPEGDRADPGVTINDSSCRFTLGNPGSVNMTTTINWAHFTGLGAPMLNADAAAPAATAFAGFSYFSGPNGGIGTAYADRVNAKTSGSAVAYHDLGPQAFVKFGLRLDTQTDPFTSADSLSSQVKVSVVEHS